MYHCGADVHSKSTTLTVLDGKGREVLAKAVATTREELQEAVRPFLKRRVRVIQETGSCQAFVHGVFAEVGAEVVTVHANHMKVITASKKKTDKRDSFQLAWHSLKDNLPEPVYVPSPHEQDLRTLLAAQQRVRKARTVISNGVRGQLKALGLVLPPNALGRPSGWERLLDADMPEASRLVAALSHEIWAALTQALSTIERELERRLEADETAHRMRTVPGVGLVCTAAARAYLGDLHRFRGRKTAVSYAGFCPRQRDSGERLRRGHLTKEGPPRLRAAYVQAAHALINRGFRGHSTWRGWYERLLHRKPHKNIAVTAVARRLFQLTYQVGRSDQAFRPPQSTAA